jgi:cell division protein FtsB
MQDHLKSILEKQLKILSDVRNVALYIFTLIVMAISWSTIKTIQSNYDLQKQISVLKQQNDVLSLQNNNQRLQNKYYQTNSYQELAARQNLGLAAPGENILLVPKAIALKYAAGVSSNRTDLTTPNSSRSRYSKNLEAWRDFLLGRDQPQ